MLDLHLLDDSGSVVGDTDLLVGREDELVKSLGAEGGSESGGN